MALSAAPTLTMGSAGNLIAANTQCTSATPVTATFYVGVAGQSGAQGSTTTGSALGGRVQVWSTGTSTITTGAYVQVQIFSTSDGTNYDTVPFAGTNFQIATLANATAGASVDLPPGQYSMSLTNSDTAHQVSVKATLATVA